MMQVIAFINWVRCASSSALQCFFFSDFQYFFKSHLYFIWINNNTIYFKCLVRLLDYWACWHSIQAVPDLHGAKKRHFGPKRSLLGSLAAQKRPNISQKCVVTMIPTQTEQPVAVGTKSGPRGPPRTSKATKRGTLGPNGHFFLPVFDHFLGLGGSKLAVTAMYEQGVPLRWSGHPTRLYLD